MSKFTKQVERKPDSIRNFVQIIEQLEIVAKWFTNKSGDNFAAVFEAFDNKDLTPSDLNCNGINNANDAISLNSTSSNSLNGSYNIKGHYYENLFDNTGAVIVKPGLFYKPRLMSRDQAIEFVKQVEKSIKSVRALENIISLFTKINVHDEEGIKTFMSSGLMFKAFMKYCVASVISVGFKVVETPSLANNEKLNYPISDSLVNFAAIDGKDIQNNNQASAFIRMAIGLRFNNEYVKIRTDANNQKSVFLHLRDPLDTRSELQLGPSETDRIFEMCIKSMISKIFTVIGSYSLFSRPPKSIIGSDAMSNSALRQIMGGADGGRSSRGQTGLSVLRLYPSGVSSMA